LLQLHETALGASVFHRVRIAADAVARQLDRRAIARRVAAETAAQVHYADWLMLMRLMMMLRLAAVCLR
jgi:hypothetical protein